MGDNDENVPEEEEEFIDASLTGKEYLDVRVANIGEPSSTRDLQAVFQIPVEVSAVLGKSRLSINELLKLHRGTVVELDRHVGEAVDVFVNDRLIARGEVVLVNDQLGVTMTEVLKREAKGGL